MVSNGQLYPPIQPYQENDYSLSQVKRFAMAQTELSSSWRTEFLAIVNDGLAKSGESMFLGEDKILSALNHVVYERRNLNYSFENSRNISNQVKFYSDFGFDGMVGVFKYGKCSLVIFKTRCMNLLKCSIDIITQVEIKTEPDPTPNWRTYQAPIKDGQKTVNKTVSEKKPVEHKKEVKIGKIVLRVGEGGVVIGAIALIVLIVKALLGNHHDSGDPGGAPPTPPPIVPPVVPGGPGGAPTTK